MVTGSRFTVQIRAGLFAMGPDRRIDCRRQQQNIDIDPDRKAVFAEKYTNQVEKY